MPEIKSVMGLIVQDELAKVTVTRCDSAGSLGFQNSEALAHELLQMLFRAFFSLIEGGFLPPLDDIS